MDPRVADIRTRLEGIAEELAEVSMDVLREAIEQGARQRPPEEKIYSQTRRTIEKAARQLDRLEAIDDEHSAES